MAVRLLTAASCLLTRGFSGLRSVYLTWRVCCGGSLAHCGFVFSDPWLFLMLTFLIWEPLKTQGIIASMHYNDRTFSLSDCLLPMVAFAFCDCGFL